MIKYTNIPIHNNSRYANQTTYWSGSDNIIRWQRNMKDPENYQFLKDRGWDTKFSIQYQFNSHGFRCAEFNNTPVYIALGCSFTEGVGTPVEDTWPWLLSKKLQQPVLNLGVGGSSLDTCFRLLEYYIDKLNIMGVFVLEPPPDRFEIFNRTTPITILPSTQLTGDLKIIHRYWAAGKDNTNYNIKKNRLAISALCTNIKLVNLESDKLYTSFQIDMARDLMHFARLTNQSITDKFFNQFNQLS